MLVVPTSKLTPIRLWLDHVLNIAHAFGTLILKETFKSLVQRRAARYATSRYRQTSSVNNMLNLLEWYPLAERRADGRLAMFYKIVNGQVAIDPTSYLTPLQSTRSSRRNNLQSFQIPYCKQDFILYSFFPSTIRLWNSLSQDIVSAPSLAAFQNRISNRDHSVKV